MDGEYKIFTQIFPVRSEFFHADTQTDWQKNVYIVSVS